MLKTHHRLAITAFAALAAGTAHATPIATESFSIPPYTAGNALNGQNSWSGGESKSSVSATGLDNAGMLGETGGSVTGLSGFASSGNEIASSVTSGTDDESGTGSMYVAFLVSGTDNSGDDWNYGRFLLDSSGGQTLQLGLLNGQFSAGGSTSGFSGTQYTSGTTALVVAKMTVTSTGSSTNETLDVWFNPTDASSDTTLTSTAQGTILGKGINLIVNSWGSVQFGVEMRGSANLNYFQDEFRAAKTLADLNLAGGVIPEPASLALMGLGGLMMLGRSRRRA